MMRWVIIAKVLIKRLDFLVRICVKKSRQWWAGHVEPTEQRRNDYWAMMWKLNETDHLEDIGLGGRIILKYTLKKCGGMA